MFINIYDLYFILQKFKNDDDGWITKTFPLNRFQQTFQRSQHNHNNPTSRLKHHHLTQKSESSTTAIVPFISFSLDDHKR